MVGTEIKLGQVQVAIERLVKKHNISIAEWNLKTKRVERILGRLLRQRDELIGRAQNNEDNTKERAGNSYVAP